MVRDVEIVPFRNLVEQVLRIIQAQIDAPTSCRSCSEDGEAIRSSHLADLHTRFLLWVGNLGAGHRHQDPRSLDKRLQDAPEVASHIRGIIIEIRDLLKQNQSPCECQEAETGSFNQISPEDEEDALVMQLLGCETSKTCTASWLRASLDNAIGRLFRISSLIAKATTRDKFARAESKCSLRVFEPYDIDHIQEKVKAASGKASAWLINRMGKANTKRRQFLTYSQQHREELSKDSIWSNEEAEEEQCGSNGKSRCYEAHLERSTGLSEGTKISLAPTKASTVGQFDPGAFDYGLDDARSYTTVATSIVDGQAFTAMKVPGLEKFASPGEHFVCPLCQTVQRFNGQASWKKHALADLKAYICTSKDCGMLMFGSFGAWQSHEMDCHRRRWSCQLCGLPCKDEADTKMHLDQSHEGAANDDQIDTLLHASSSPAEILLAKDCPFCNWDATLKGKNSMPCGNELAVPWKRFMKHLGRHLEEFTLFVFPQPEQEDDQEDDGKGSNAVRANSEEDHDTLSSLSSFRSQNRSSLDEGTGIGPASHERENLIPEIEPQELVPTRVSSLSPALVHQDDARRVSNSSSKSNLRLSTLDCQALTTKAAAYPSPSRSLTSIPQAHTIEDISWLPSAENFHNDNIDPAAGSGPNSPDQPGPKYCYCLQGAYGEMVGCENRECDRQLFHLGCTELKSMPEKYQQWFCSSCRQPSVRNFKRADPDIPLYPSQGQPTHYAYPNDLATPPMRKPFYTEDETNPFLMSYASIAGVDVSTTEAPSYQDVSTAYASTIAAHPPNSYARRVTAPTFDNAFFSRPIAPSQNTQHVPLASSRISPGDGMEGHNIQRAVTRGDPPQAYDGKYYCDFAPECAGQYFDRKGEWSKHMDKHDRPYRCPQPQCSGRAGFTSSGGLLRHEREVHGSRASKEQLYCTIPECVRSSGKGFSRKYNLKEHLRRVHGITAPDATKPQQEDVFQQKPREVAEDKAPGANLFEAPASRSLEVGDLDHLPSHPDDMLEDRVASENTNADKPLSARIADLIDVPIHGDSGNASMESEKQLQRLRQMNKDENWGLQDYQLQLMMLEQQNKKRLLMARSQQDNFPYHGLPSAVNSQTEKLDFGMPSLIREGQNEETLLTKEDYDTQLNLLEEKNKQHLLTEGTRAWQRAGTWNIPPQRSRADGYATDVDEPAREGSSATKQRRLTKDQHAVLEAQYAQEATPDTSTKQDLADSLGTSFDKVNNWFQNRRAKARQDAKKASMPWPSFPQPQPSPRVLESMEKLTSNNTFPAIDHQPMDSDRTPAEPGLGKQYGQHEWRSLTDERRMDEERRMREEQRMHEERRMQEMRAGGINEGRRREAAYLAAQEERDRHLQLNFEAPPQTHPSQYPSRFDLGHPRETGFTESLREQSMREAEELMQQEKERMWRDVAHKEHEVAARKTEPKRPVAPSARP
ncbi:hypothetical protein Q7P37_008818 [Cladosporium fusiforme]